MELHVARGLPAARRLRLLEAPLSRDMAGGLASFPPALNRHLTKIRPNDVPRVCELLRPKVRADELLR